MIVREGTDCLAFRCGCEMPGCSIWRDSASALAQKVEFLGMLAPPLVRPSLPVRTMTVSDMPNELASLKTQPFALRLKPSLSRSSIMAFRIHTERPNSRCPPALSSMYNMHRTPCSIVGQSGQPRNRRCQSRPGPLYRHFFTTCLPTLTNAYGAVQNPKGRQVNL
jgi:hypothetical protein